ncbi:MAG: imidazoleglycerol-phosphate dehydratase HisB [Oscillospiraceae bacterium]|nr:imidazoleglycerol-phosphate dehydratase HisB [Oscillospiraceae bacterium]
MIQSSPVRLERNTRETRISASLGISDSGKGKFEGTSGIGFFDHMLNSFCVHGGFEFIATIEGDTFVDCHHTVEDTGIVLGSLFDMLLDDRSGIARFGNAFVPMDEALAFCAADISGRPFLVFDDGGYIKAHSVGGYDTEISEEFFRAFAFNAKLTLHLRLQYGSNAHHCIEALYKAAARAIKQACNLGAAGILSAKGVL